MTKTWKWILGILAVLVVLGLVACAVFVWRNNALTSFAYRFDQRQPNAPSVNGTPVAPGNQQGQTMPYGFRQDRGFGYGYERRGPMMGPMMGGRGFGHGMPFGMGFFLLGGILHLLIPLGLLALVAFLFYQLGKRAGLSTAAAAPQAPPPAPRKVAKS
jgi:hypothetical protein